MKTLASVKLLMVFWILISKTWYQPLKFCSNFRLLSLQIYKQISFSICSGMYLLQPPWCKLDIFVAYVEIGSLEDEILACPTPREIIPSLQRSEFLLGLSLCMIAFRTRDTTAAFAECRPLCCTGKLVTVRPNVSRMWPASHYDSPMNASLIIGLLDSRYFIARWDLSVRSAGYSLMYFDNCNITSCVCC